MQYANKYYLVKPQDAVLKFAEITRLRMDAQHIADTYCDTLFHMQI